MSVNFRASSTESCSPTVPASTEVKTAYSPEEFKTLQLKKHPFPANAIVTGDLDLSDCKGLTSTPEGLHVKDGLILSRCTGLTALSEGLTVGGDLYLSICTGLAALPKGLTV